MAAQNVDLFDAYFRRADLDKDGRISGSEGVAFFQGSNLPKQVLAQIWMHADQNKTGFLGRNEFYNALKLVTVAQSKRELTPDMVKAALYGPASTKIPAPQITFAAQPTLQSNSPVGHHIAPSHGVAPNNVGLGGTNGPPNVNMGQQFFPSQQTQSAKPPRPMHIPANFHPQQASITPSHPPTSHSSSDWLGGVANVPSAGVSSPNPNQVGFGPVVTGLQPTPQPTNMLTQAGVTKRDSPIMASPLEVGKTPRPLLASGNGFIPGPVFGDASSTSFSQPKQEFTVPASFAGASTNSSNNIPVSTVSQMAIKSGGVGSPQDSFSQQSGGSQYQQTTGKGNPQVPLPPSTAAKTSTSYGFTAGAGNVTAAPSQAPWPKITQTDVQKYTRVFVAVDTDRDGKISGEQARNLFLSWRLPREVLKQVWDLSDQDNDSMLSIREFFIALYLMERYREGRPLPSVLPSGVLLDEGLLPATGQFASSQNSTSSKPNPPGVQQPRVMPTPHQSTHADRARVPNQGPLPLPDESKPPSPQKSKVPVLEKNFIDQLSEGEQNSLNSKFKEATEANKKVEELEKEIVEARQKIEFYSSKMQELVLYKSRCDSRFNEITERVSADKREVESLAKKYEEKYKQRGDVASKLTIEESTFRDIQEEKMNLYRAIVKIDQSGKPETIQVEADRIKLELEELMKSLNERCKTYSLRSKPTTLVELPFGWQLGIQEGAADWDESWDKFEDEGFTIVKELTVDVQNVVAPPKEKILRKKQSYVIDETEVSSPVANGINIKKVASSDEKVSNDAHSEDGITSSPNGSPLSRNASESPSKQSHTSHHNLDNQSEHGGVDSVTSGEKGFDEPKWGNFDTHYDTDSLWDFNSGSNKEMDNTFFDSGDLGLPPIRTDFSYNENKNLPKKSSFNDSGSSPQSDTSFHNNKSSFVFDSVPSTPQSDFYQNKTTFQFDSVPSSPQINNNLFENKTSFQFDSVPSSPQINNNLFENKTAFQFDSVPSTPMYGFGDTSEGGGRTLDSFSRFDSFNTSETGQFQARDSFSRFDSFRSTADSEYGQGFFAQQDSLGRFDSFRSSTEDSQQRDYGRFDSIRSNRDSYGFSSFDDSSDPFGSGPFKTDSQTPRRDSDTWKPF